MIRLRNALLLLGGMTASLCACVEIGNHLIKIPPGVYQAVDPPTFSCSIGTAPILTISVESVRNHEAAAGDSIGLYDYKPDSTPERSLIRLDAPDGRDLR